MSSDDIVRIDIAELRRLGYLQELNRRFLHPLGLALEVIVDKETKEERLGGVWDYRDDPEGMRYGEGPHAPELDKAKAIEEELEQRAPARRAALGYVVQPVEGTRNLDDVEHLANVVRKLLPGAGGRHQAEDPFVVLYPFSILIDGRVEVSDDEVRALERLGLEVDR